MQTKEGKFTKPYDVVLFAYAVLKRLGCGKVDTFEQRLKSQKAQYFAQLFRVSPPYVFGLYLRGPYSSALAHDLYAISDDGSIDVDLSKFTPAELEERFIKLKKLIGGIGARELELASTLHWLLRVANFSQGMAQEKLREWKGADEKELRKAANLISGL